MLSQLFVTKKDVRIEWMGLTKADKNGKQKFSIQVATKTPEGHTVTFYGAQDKDFNPAVKVGDVINLDMKVRAYKDGLYCDIVGHEIVNGGNGSKASGVKI